MNLSAFAAVGIGAACGAWLRWGLGVWLNPVFGAFPLGTLAANLIGGTLMGGVLAFIETTPGLSPVLKLLLTTGLLGGLTTFSSFSAEAFHLAQRGAWGWFAAHLGAHVAGAILCTWLGYAVVSAARG